MLRVIIPVHPFEFESVLDKLHRWSVQYDWEDHGPDITCTLDVITDHHGFAQKLNGDRFNTEDPFWFRTDEERAEIRNTESLLEQLRNRSNKKAQPTETESDILMRHVREKAKEQSDV